MQKFLHNNSLSIVVFALFLIFLVGETATGYTQQNHDLEEHNQPTQSLGEYMTGGDYIEGVFENWESEFLQMGSYVLLTVYLRQKGSAESKKLEGREENDCEPQTGNPQAPGPVRKGGWRLKLYENSLGLAFLVLFLLSFTLHAYGGAQAACEQSIQHGESSCVGTLGFMGTSEFWYQSFQNWQSEFLAVFAIVVLSIFLRQKSSPESKPVSAPHHQTGSA